MSVLNLDTLATLRRSVVPCLFVTALLPMAARAEVEIAPLAGFRMGGEFDVRNRDNDREDTVKFRDSESFGLALNVDLDKAGKQTELYFGRQTTTASTSDQLLTPASRTIDLTIYQLQFGGLYFPGGTHTGGFVSGVIGVSRLDPEPSGLESHHRAALSLGGGYKLALTDNLLARFDLRAIYTVLDSGGSIFCDAGCAVRFKSNGYLQAEASAGLAIRF